MITRPYNLGDRAWYPHWRYIFWGAFHVDTQHIALYIMSGRSWNMAVVRFGRMRYRHTAAHVWTVVEHGGTKYFVFWVLYRHTAHCTVHVWTAMKHDNNFGLDGHRHRAAHVWPVVEDGSTKYFVSWVLYRHTARCTVHVRTVMKHDSGFSLDGYAIGTGQHMSGW